ncbi:hypothetical protein OBRU01_06102 [Operophtera brumata]|uniref:Uncharacterized protein n=1 Tax=Operophtera brumata TaxID=104452 RepID=A0A0L7LJ18_OPEBR|nr:hypothetical protein OBRU01_06102 [Operophtera brumata]
MPGDAQSGSRGEAEDIHHTIHCAVEAPGELHQPFLERMVPLLAALVDDNSALTRQHTLRAVCCLASLARRRGCFTTDILHKIYFVVLKRLDDSSDRVRSGAVHTLCTLFRCRPEPYDTVVFGAHIDAVLPTKNSLRVSRNYYNLATDSALILLADLDPKVLMKKVKANIHLYRNKSACEKLSTHFKETLPLIEASIKKADFLVIDAEFTGLINGRDVSVFDLPRDYYKCLFKGSTEFLVIQFGLCAFHWDEEKKHYMNDAFNFHLFPRGKPGTEKIFLQKSVKEKDIIPIPEEHKSYIDETWCNSFVRLLLYQELKMRCKDEILLETLILENKNRVLKVVRMKSQNDESNQTAQKKEREWEELEDAVGFSKEKLVIGQNMLIQFLYFQEKLVIGHNMLIQFL